MLLGGDELGRTQGGNNNAYCQDNEVSWYDWEAADLAMLDFTRRLVRFRRDHPVFHRRRWFEGSAGAPGLLDIAWFDADGAAMSAERWRGRDGNVVGIFMSADGLVGNDGQPIGDDSFYLAFNGSDRDIVFALPDGSFGDGWRRVLDTAASPSFAPDIDARPVADRFEARAHGVVVLQRSADDLG